MPDEKKARLAVPINFTSIITLLFLFAVAMTAAYIWGVMSGRQYGQEPKPAPMEVAEGSRQKQTGEQERILKAQELEFANVLRGENPPNVPAEKKPEAPVVESKASDDAKMEMPASDAPEKKADSPKATPEQQDDGMYFDYVYQMAAFRDEQTADNLRERLEGRGLRTRLERKGKAYIVLAVLRGTAERALELTQIARELRLGEPLLRSKRQAIRR